MYDDGETPVKSLKTLEKALADEKPVSSAR